MTTTPRDPHWQNLGARRVPKLSDLATLRSALSVAAQHLTWQVNE